MCSDIQQGRRFFDAQESPIQVAKRSEMGIAFMKGLRFIHTQESCFEAWKSSHMGCVSRLCGRFVDAQESRIQAANLSKMGSALPPVFNLLMLIKLLFGLRNIQMWAVPL